MSSDSRRDLYLNRLNEAVVSDLAYFGILGAVRKRYFAGADDIWKIMNNSWDAAEAIAAGVLVAGAAAVAYAAQHDRANALDLATHWLNLRARFGTNVITWLQHYTATHVYLQYAEIIGDSRPSITWYLAELGADGRLARQVAKRVAVTGRLARIIEDTQLGDVFWSPDPGAETLAAIATLDVGRLQYEPGLARATLELIRRPLTPPHLFAPVPSELREVVYAEARLLLR